MAQKTYRIGDVANLMGLSRDTLRYYEKRGILSSKKEKNGYRYYTGGQLPALAKIETLKSYGFTLAEVKELLLLPELLLLR